METKNEIAESSKKRYKKDKRRYVVNLIICIGWMFYLPIHVSFYLGEVDWSPMPWYAPIMMLVYNLFTALVAYDVTRAWMTVNAHKIAEEIFEEDIEKEDE